MKTTQVFINLTLLVISSYDQFEFMTLTRCCNLFLSHCFVAVSYYFDVRYLFTCSVPYPFYPLDLSQAVCSESHYKSIVFPTEVMWLWSSFHVFSLSPLSRLWTWHWVTRAFMLSQKHQFKEIRNEILCDTRFLNALATMRSIMGKQDLLAGKHEQQVGYLHCFELSQQRDNTGENHSIGAITTDL